MTLLSLDPGRVAAIRALASEIADSVQQYIDQHTTSTVERATLRLLGIDGVTSDGTPHPNQIAETLRPALGRGVARAIANGVIATGLTPSELAKAAGERRVDILSLPQADEDTVRRVAAELAEPQVQRILAMRRYREDALQQHPDPQNRPLLYVIVATGNIYEDVEQAASAVHSGADIIAVIRTTAQSLLDFVPYGPTTEGYGGTYATQENFRIMRAALDEAGAKAGRYIRLVNYASGLCMPEISVMGALERLDMMLNDSMYGILFRDINMYRTFVDQHFSRAVNALAGITINTGEDNYLTTADAVEKAHTVLASDFINEQFALRSGMVPGQMGLGHAFEIDPRIENCFLYELSHAALVRACFPDHPLKYMPPTKHITGNIFHAYMYHTLFNLAGVVTGQGIQLLGMLTEALHTPHLADRALALDNARYVFNAAAGLSGEIALNPDGFIVRRAHEVLDEAERFLGAVAEEGLMTAIEKGMFADIARPRTGGKGYADVFEKKSDYFNPLYDVFRTQLPGVHLG